MFAVSHLPVNSDIGRLGDLLGSLERSSRRIESRSFLSSVPFGLHLRISYGQSHEYASLSFSHGQLQPPEIDQKKDTRG